MTVAQKMKLLSRPVLRRQHQGATASIQHPLDWGAHLWRCGHHGRQAHLYPWIVCVGGITYGQPEHRREGGASVYRQYASRIRNLAINSLDVPEGDVQVTCRISPTGQIRVEGPFAYPLSDTYYLSLEGDELPELGNMRCPKGAIIQITPLSGGGNVYVQGGVEPLGTSSDGGRVYRITGDFMIQSS